MNYNGAAKIRVTQWITHFELHQKEYEEFAEKSKEYCPPEFVNHIQEMLKLTEETTDCLRKSLNFLT